MRFEKPKFKIKKLLKLKDLDYIQPDEVDIFFQDIRKNSARTHQETFQHINILKPCNEYKSSNSFNRNHGHNLRSPNIKLTNLSNSLLSTPKTPFQKPFTFATPCQRDNANSLGLTPMINSNFGGIPITPMLYNTLRVITPNETNCKLDQQVDFPDILELIDNDDTPLESVDRELTKFKEVNLSDKTVVDYLLEIVMDYQGAMKPVIPPVTYSKNDVDILKTRRKCRRAKPVSFEEKQYYEKERRQKAREQRQKRKILLSQRTNGTRRVIFYKCKINFLQLKVKCCHRELKDMFIQGEIPVLKPSISEE